VSLNRIETKHDTQNKNSNDNQRHTNIQIKNVKKKLLNGGCNRQKKVATSFSFCRLPGKFVIRFSFPFVVINKVLEAKSFLTCLHREKKCNASHHPFGRLFFGFQIEGPDVGWSSHLGLVNWAGIHVLQFLLVHSDCLDEDNWYCGSEVFHDTLTD